MHVMERRQMMKQTGMSRKGGLTHRTWAGFDADERRSVVGALDRSDVVAAAEAIDAVGLANAARTDDLDALVSAFERALDGARSSNRSVGHLLRVLVAPALQAIQDELGDESAHPSVEALGRAGEAVGEQLSFAGVRLVFAAAIEWAMPARPELRQLVAADERFAIAPEQAPPVVPARPLTPVPEDVREERRDRRQRDAADRRARDAQRRAARPYLRADLELDDHPVAPTPVAETPSDDVLTPIRLRHPRLPADVAGHLLAGTLGTVLLRWGPGPADAKRRPVVVVGASAKHLWVRPCYSNDYLAGAWRAVRIDDWSRCGLNHEGFVAIDVLEVPRKRVKLTEHRFTLHDWNRICRGEVHGD